MSCSGRELFEDRPLGLDGEGHRDEATDERDRREDGENVVDAEIANHEADEYRTYRRPGPQPGTAEPGPDRPQTGGVELGGIQVERERDGRQNRIGRGGQDDDLGGRGEDLTEIVKAAGMPEYDVPTTVMLKYTAWGTPVDISAPPADQVAPAATRRQLERVSGVAGAQVKR